MKRMICLIFICCALSGLAACSKESGNDAESRTEEAADGKIQTAGEAGTDGKLQMTVTEEQPAAAAEADKEEAPPEAAAESTLDGAKADQQGDAGTITEDQAYEAVRKYYFTQHPGMEDPSSEGEAQSYWDVSTAENNEIVVLYRSYTGALIRFYVNPASGEVYITEQVPGIIDDEQRTDETFNVRDYM